MAAAIEVENPATGEVLGSVPELSPAEVSKLVDRARAAQPAWRRLGFGGRAKVLRRARRLLLRDAERLIRTTIAETGKVWEDVQSSELIFSALVLDFWPRHARRYLADRRVRRTTIVGLGKKMLTRYEPLGVVGIITPWNYPLALPLGDAVPALMAGNAVVVKPSELTPMIAGELERLFLDAGVPPGVFSVATGRGETGAALVDAADGIAFTGSTRSGRAVAERAARSLTPVSLELGGNDAAIVLADADLERAAEATVFYSMINNGQACVSIERAYVEAPVYDEFVGLVVERVERLRHGAPGGPGTVEVGAMTMPAQLEKVRRHVDGAIAAGATALTGGNANGRVYPPTVLVGVDQSMECMNEETFGPTLPIVAVADAEEAIRLANDSEYGLGATVFSGDAARGEAIARRIEAGNVAVNDPFAFIGVLGLPMGGWKASGLGARHGADGIRKYCRRQSVIASSKVRRGPHMYPYRALQTKALLAALRAVYGRKVR